ncbi:MAG: hypothetical protein O3A20_09500, partial [Planctomycetota bacterium]|nr:hypothetical protein [Planctomycetota bacterium]
HPRIHQLVTTGSRVLSGGAPEGEASFAALAELGVRTIVCVDGARPDVEAAARLGIRTVHVPIGYDGIDATAAAQIAAVMKETEGPVYFHCHHGKHRGPAAAALALRVETGCSAEEALAVMRAAETDPKYEGLWRDATGPLPVLDPAAMPALHAVAPIADFVAAMAKMDRDWDRLILVQKAAWQSPATHPDLAPANEARIVAESLESASALLSAQQNADPRFLRFLRSAQDDARALTAALERKDATAADASYARLKRGCVACHDEYRN